MEMGFQKVQDRIEWSNQLYERFNLDNFYLGNHNKEVYRYVMEIIADKKKDTSPLWIQGELGLGKTHLLQAMVKTIHEKTPERQVCYLNEDAWSCGLERIHVLSTEYGQDPYCIASVVFGDSDIWILDDFDRIGKYPELLDITEAVFDHWRSNGNQIVIASKKAIAECAGLSKGMRNYLKAGTECKMGKPDKEAVMFYLKKQAEEESRQGFEFTEEALQYIAQYFGENYRYLSGAFVKVIAVCKLDGLGKMVDLKLTEGILRESVSLL